MMKVSFTFDDGLKDHILYAAPVLEKYHYRGLFCIITTQIGHAGYMTWEDIRELKSRGHEIASHTTTHANLYGLYKEGDIKQIREQVSNSKNHLEDELGCAVKFFAFPYNDHCGALFKIVRSLGLEPVPPQRLNLGMSPADNVEKLGLRLKQMSMKRERQAVLMFHGIATKGLYGSYADVTGEEFEKRVRDVCENSEGEYEVVRYEDYDWKVFDERSVIGRARMKLHKLASR